MKNVHRRAPFYITFFLIFLFFNACDRGHVKEYIVENTIPDSVHFMFTRKKTLDTALIPSDSSRVVYKLEYFYGSVGVHDERHKDDMSAFFIRIDSATKSVSEDAWRYEQVNKYYAKYHLKIDSSLLK